MRSSGLSRIFGAAFVVTDGDGQKLAYVYYEEESGRRSAAKLLTKDEARRIAANIAKLPEVLVANSPNAGIASVGREHLFQCSSFPLATPGIFYRPVTPVRHRTTGIFRCRGLLYPPFRKEHARDRVPLLA